MKDLMFTKMHGAGNDYIFINCLDAEPDNLGELSCRLSERHKGIGADGLVAILQSSIADFKMRMFNSDGSEGKMCGNACRCIGKFVYEKRLTDKKEITIETLAGIKYLELVTDSANEVEAVTVNMGEPIFAPADIPVKSVDNNIHISIKGAEYNIIAVSIGNPHGVIFCENPYSVNLSDFGKQIGQNLIFPEGINIEFVRVINKKELEMRVWERGSGETLACGTGACAALVAGAVGGLCDRIATVHMPGGDLEISWLEDNHIYMTGPAKISFEGIVKID